MRELFGGAADAQNRGVIVGAAGLGAGRSERGNVWWSVARGPLVRAEVGEPLGRPVVGVLGDDGPGAVGVSRGHPPGQLIGLRAGGGEQAGVEFSRHRRQEPFGELDDPGVQIPGMGVHCGQLPAYGLHNGRVRVADHGDVVVGVEVAAVVSGEQPRAIASYDLERVAVEERAERSAHGVSTPCQQVRFRRPGRRRRNAGRMGSPGDPVQASPQLVGSDCSQLSQDPVVGVVVLRDVGGVVLVLGDSARGDRPGQREPGHDEVAEDVDL